MIRILSAAAALSLLAAPAFAASVTVTLSGKTPAAAYADIVRAAQQVCFTRGGLYAALATKVCVADTVAETVAKVADPKLTQYAATQGLQLARL